MYKQNIKYIEKYRIFKFGRCEISNSFQPFVFNSEWQNPTIFPGISLHNNCMSKYNLKINNKTGRPARLGRPGSAVIVSKNANRKVSNSTHPPPHLQIYPTDSVLYFTIVALSDQSAPGRVLFSGNFFFNNALAGEYF